MVGRKQMWWWVEVLGNVWKDEVGKKRIFKICNLWPAFVQKDKGNTSYPHIKRGNAY